MILSSPDVLAAEAFNHNETSKMDLLIPIATCIFNSLKNFKSASHVVIVVINNIYIRTEPKH